MPDNKILNMFGKPYSEKDAKQKKIQQMDQAIDTLLTENQQLTEKPAQSDIAKYHLKLATLWETMYKDTTTMSTSKDTDVMYIGQAIKNIMDDYLSLLSKES